MSYSSYTWDGRLKNSKLVDQLRLIKKMAGDPHKLTVRALALLSSGAYTPTDDSLSVFTGKYDVDKAAEEALQQIIASNKLERSLIFETLLMYGSILKLRDPDSWFSTVCDPTCGRVLLDFLNKRSRTTNRHGFLKLHIIYCMSQAARMNVDGAHDAIRAYLDKTFLPYPQDLFLRNEIQRAAWHFLAEMGDPEAIEKIAGLEKEERDRDLKS